LLVALQDRSPLASTTSTQLSCLRETADELDDGRCWWRQSKAEENQEGLEPLSAWCVCWIGCARRVSKAVHGTALCTPLHGPVTWCN
jgi:hypothetical protein